MRRFLFALSCLISITSTAQNWDLIRNSNEYVWGEGTGSTLQEADQNALSDLAANISVVVRSDFTEQIRETISQGKDIDSETIINSYIKTYSNITLNNTKRMELQEIPYFRVGRYILKSEIENLFQLRLGKAQHMIDDAIEAEKAGKVDEALRHYYRAYLLAQSLPNPSKALYKDEDGDEHLITSWVPQQMRDLMDDVECKMVSRDGDEIEVLFTLNGKPVESLDFTYFDGYEWTPLFTSTQNGKGLMEMAKNFAGTNLQVRLEYEYRMEHTDRELEGVMALVPSLAFPKAKLSFKYDNKAKAPTPWNGKSAPISSLVASEEGSFARSSLAIRQAPTAVANDKVYAAVIQRVVNAIKNRTYSGIENCFTADGRDIFERLLRYGQAKLVGTPKPVFYNSPDGVVCRGTEMSFSFKNGARKSFVEDVVFTFDSCALIKNISFGLGQTAQQDILCKGIWSEQVRVAIIQFLENYKTAYALKRLDYLKTIFDDYAVIIVGNVAQNTGQSALKFDNNSKRFSRNDIRWSRYDKDQYMKKLGQCFDSNEFVNIRFASNDVVKQAKGGEFYSIQIEQDYYSSSYGDHGYLLLMVDLNNPDKPLIKVRTWQPERDPNFGLYGPGDFK
ncbi:MAG: LPP20 family lipoprotein [Bacteroidaceae bacterium]|nr:LPP20 family lipoprotein [Bacteroidaceae bacterium]